MISYDVKMISGWPKTNYMNEQLIRPSHKSIYGHVRPYHEAILRMPLQALGAYFEAKAYNAL